MTRMTLADLIDLETQLARDRGKDPRALDARDSGARGAGTQPRARAKLLRRWIEERREAEPAQLPGRAVAGVLRGIVAALGIAGLVLGWSAATALLRYTGQEPVDVWDFLLAFVGLQIFLFLLLLSSFFLPLAAFGTPLAGLVRSALAAIYPRLAARMMERGAGQLADWQALWHRLRSRRSLYHHVEPWILLGMTQTFGVAFNLGALLGCLRLIVFSDIAFSWSTTLIQLDAPRFHGLVHALSAPFAWLWPDAEPTRALVEATRYSRLEGAYVLSGAGRAARPDIVGGWWPFLVAALAAYGLLPRCAALAFARFRAARLLAGLPFDDAEVTRLMRRLSEPRVDTRSATVETAPASSVAPPLPAVARAGGTRCAVLLWRDVPSTPDLATAVERQIRCPVAAVQEAGGRDYEEGEIDWTRVADGSDPIVVVAEGWEAPDKAVLRLVRELRRTLGPRRHVVVLLAQIGDGGIRPSPHSEVRIWEEELARLEDPFLSVEPLQGMA